MEDLSPQGLRSHPWARRAAGAALWVLATSFCVGALLWVTPGSPRGQGQAFLQWWAGFWWGAARWDLGTSYRGLPIADLLLLGARTTVPLVLAAILMALAAAWTVTALSDSTARPLQWVARAVRSALQALSVVPAFLLVYLQQVVIAVPPEGPVTWAAAVFALAIGDGLFLDVHGVVERERVAVLRKDFVAGARLRGEPIAPIIRRHLLVPVLHLVSSRVQWLFGAVLVVEMCLGLQGLGLIGYRAAQHEDMPLLLAAVVGFASALSIVRLVLDGLAEVADPRPRSTILGGGA